LKGGFRSHPLTNISLHQEIEMVLDLSLEIPITFSTPEQASGLCE
jgi:hypothetical protein